MRKFLSLIIVASFLLTGLSLVAAQDDVVELTMGSWRTEDIEQWDAIIAAFNEQHPNIQISFEPTLNTEYDSSLQAHVELIHGELFHVELIQGELRNSR